MSDDWTLTAEQWEFLDGYRELIELAQTNEKALDGLRQIPQQQAWKQLFGDISLDEAIDRWESEATDGQDV